MINFVDAFMQIIKQFGQIVLFQLLEFISVTYLSP